MTARDECGAWGDMCGWSVWNVYVVGFWVRWWVGAGIGYGLFKSCGNRGSVRRVSVLGCGGEDGVGGTVRGVGPGSGMMG